MTNSWQKRQQILAAAFVLLVPGLGAMAQQPQTTKEPEYVGKVMLLGSDGDLISLERQTPRFEGKTSNYVFKVKSQARRAVLGAKSPVRTDPQAHFVVRGQVADVDPATLIHMYRVDVGKDERYYVTNTTSATFAGAKGTTTDREGLPLSIEKFGTASFNVSSAQPLAPGEYCFSTAAGMAVDCFGVDAKQ